MIEVTIEDMYSEACRKVGELTVTNSILVTEVQRLSAQVEALEDRGGDESVPPVVGVERV